MEGAEKAKKFNYIEGGRDVEAFKKLIGVIGRLALLVLFVIGIMILSGMIIAPVFYHFTGTEFFPQDVDLQGISENYYIINNLISQISIIIAVFITYKIFQEKDQISLGLKERSFLKKGLEGSIWGIVLITVPFFIVWLFRSINIVDINTGFMVIKSLGKMILLYLTVAFGEEIISRGYIHGLIKRYYGIKPAIIVTSLIFSLLHIFNDNFLQNPLPLISLFLAGVLFGVSREVTGGLWVPIGIHFTWNLFQGNVYGFEVSGLNFGLSVLEIERTGHPLITGGEFGLEGSLVTIIFMILAIYIHWWYYKKRRDSGEPPVQLNEE